MSASGGRTQGRSRGQAVVEFGLVAVLFFTLVFAIFDFGMVLSDWIGVTTAASVGARQAAVGACLEGPAADPATCLVLNGLRIETSVVGAVMESAPLLATGNAKPGVLAADHCQNPPQPADPLNPQLCLSRVDIAVANLNVAGVYCRAAELWLNSLTNVRTLTLTPITSGWAGESCTATPPSPQINDALSIVVRTRIQLPAPLPGLPAVMEAESSSTVRFEGAYVQ